MLLFVAWLGVCHTLNGWSRLLGARPQLGARQLGASRQWCCPWRHARRLWYGVTTVRIDSHMAPHVMMTSGCICPWVEDGIAHRWDRDHMTGSAPSQ